MFERLEPFATGMLPVEHGNEIYWETSGSRTGRPVLYLHGGPGGGLGRGNYRGVVDPERFLLVGFDQRGCGNSRPLASDPAADLSTNTTPQLIADIETVREHLGLEHWLVYGASWGTSLALMYAQAHPDRVTGLVLAAVGTTSTDSVTWLTEDLRRSFPREWYAYADAVPRLAGERVVDAYARALRTGSAEERAAAALAWCRWEDTHMSFDPHFEPFLSVAAAQFQLVFATLVTHYWSNSGFGGDEVMGRMDRLADIPGVLIHGRLDISSPLEEPWLLQRAWPSSRLVILEEGHGGPAMTTAVIAAIEELGMQHHAHDREPAYHRSDE